MKDANKSKLANLVVTLCAFAIPCLLLAMFIIHGRRLDKRNKELSALLDESHRNFEAISDKHLACQNLLDTSENAFKISIKDLVNENIRLTEEKSSLKLLQKSLEKKFGKEKSEDIERRSKILKHDMLKVNDVNFTVFFNPIDPGMKMFNVILLSDKEHNKSKSHISKLDPYVRQILKEDTSSISYYDDISIIVRNVPNESLDPHKFSFIIAEIWQSQPKPSNKRSKK